MRADVMSRRTFFIRTTAVSLALLRRATFGQVQNPVALEPKVVPPEDVAAEIGSLSKSVRFHFSGVAFFQGKLYASCNVGLRVEVPQHHYRERSHSRR